MKRYRITPQAQLDLTHIIDYIALRNPQSAIKVFDALHAAMRQIARTPGIDAKTSQIGRCCSSPSTHT